MLTRRQFLARNLQGASLLAAGTVVPQFLADTAQAAEAGKETILVVIELTGGNDGLNTVIPWADDLYHKFRPTLRFTREQVIRVDDHVGLHPAMRSLEPMLRNGQVAVIQGVGYPNPDRSHFESMDIWQQADPRRKTPIGWIARGVADLQDKQGGVPVMQVGPERLPVALTGAPSGVVTINNQQPLRLYLGDSPPRPAFPNAPNRFVPVSPAMTRSVPNEKYQARKKLIEDLAKTSGERGGEGMLPFVQRRQLQTYSTLDRLQELLQNANFNDGRFPVNSLGQKLQLVARLIQKDFGTRVFYVSLDGFDTHSNQADPHRNLLQQIADSLSVFFTELQRTGHDKRVLAMTFSEFGRRVQENGSRGTDHGAGSCLIVAGPGVKGGASGKHPSLGDLDQGDLKHHTDFRRVYATLLDGWLGCSSKAVLHGTFEALDFLKPKA